MTLKFRGVRLEKKVCDGFSANFVFLMEFFLIIPSSSYLFVILSERNCKSTTDKLSTFATKCVPFRSIRSTIKIDFSGKSFEICQPWKCPLSSTEKGKNESYERSGKIMGVVPQIHIDESVDAFENLINSRISLKPIFFTCSWNAIFRFWQQCSSKFERLSFVQEKKDSGK